MAFDIKICGLKTDETLAAALAGGASHVGFIFFAKSPRYVEPVEAGRLRQSAIGRAKAVAVSVDLLEELFALGFVGALGRGALELVEADAAVAVAVDLVEARRFGRWRPKAAADADDTRHG